MKNIFILAVLILNTSLINAQNSNWTKSTNSPSDRRFYGSHVIGDTVYLIGKPTNDGKPQGTVSECWAFYPPDSSWSRRADIPQSIRWPGNIVVGGKLYVGLSTNVSNSLLENRFHIFDPKTNKWTKSSDLTLKYVNALRPATFANGTSIFVLDFDNNFYAYDVISDKWSVKTSPKFSQRYLSSFVSTANKGIVIGGVKNGFPPTNDCWEYDFSKDIWTQLADMPTAGKYTMATILDNQKIITIAGNTPSLGDTSAIWSYDIDKNKWTKEKDFPIAKSHMNGFNYKGTYYCGFGDLNYFYSLSNNSTECDLIKTVQIFAESPVLMTNWTKSTNSPSDRRFYGSHVIGDTVYLIGKPTNDGKPQGTVSECWAFYPPDSSWSRRADIPQSIRWPGNIVVGGKLYVGLSTNVSNSLLENRFHIFDPKTNKWTKSSDLTLKYVNALRPATFANGTSIFVLDFDNNFYAYDVISDKWSVKTSPKFSQRYLSSFVSTANKGIVIGGVKNGFPPTNDCWEYDFSKDIWTQLADMPTAGKYTMATILDNQKIITIAGNTPSLGDTSAIWSYDIDKNKWTKEKDFPIAKSHMNGFNYKGTYYCGFGDLNYFYRLSRNNTLRWSTGETGPSIFVNPKKTSFVSVTDGYCSDTIFFNRTNSSNAETKYDTIRVYERISVQDTLIINGVFSSTNGDFKNSIKLFPNPAKDYLIIDFGDYELMGDFHVDIMDVTGKLVHRSDITSKTVEIKLGNWSGEGLYLLNIVNLNGVTIESRKIVIQ